MKTDTDQPERSFEEYLASLDDEQTLRDSRVLIEMMQHISGHEPMLLPRSRGQTIHVRSSSEYGRLIVRSNGI